MNLCKSLEAAGVSWISVHGRTKEQRNQPVNLEAIKLIKENVGVPVIANGDIKSVEDIEEVKKLTGIDALCDLFLFFYSIFLPSNAVKSR